MIEMLAVEPNNVVAYRTEGKITAADFEYVADAIKEKAGEEERMHLYAEMESFDGISPKVFIQELAFGAAHLDTLRSFDRVAVVTDVDLIDSLAQLENTVVPGIEVRTYSTSKKAHAITWLVSGDTEQSVSGS